MGSIWGTNQSGPPFGPDIFNIEHGTPLRASAKRRASALARSGWTGVILVPHEALPAWEQRTVTMLTLLPLSVARRPAELKERANVCLFWGLTGPRVLSLQDGAPSNPVSVA